MTKTAHAGAYAPAPDYDSGIRGGPTLPRDIAYAGGFGHGPGDAAPEAGRHALVYAPLQPSGQKIAIAVALLGLLDAVPVLSLGDGRLVRDADGRLAWSERLTPEQEAGLAVATQVRLPAVVDLHTGEIVSNDPYSLIWELDRHVRPELGDATATELYPPALEEAQRHWDERTFHALHAGVYRAGRIDDQAEYEREVARVYRYLLDIDAHLGHSPWLLGDVLTASDVYLFSMLIRYDQVYATGFRLHVYRIRDLPNVWRYLVDLWRQDAFRFTTDFDAISRGYFLGVPHLNRGIVPVGPGNTFLDAALAAAGDPA